MNRAHSSEVWRNADGIHTRRYHSMLLATYVHMYVHEEFEIQCNLLRKYPG